MQPKTNLPNLDLAACVYLDTETTGLYPPEDEVLAVAIADADGELLLDSLVRPVRNAEWPEAQAIHGIDPEDTADAPTLTELADAIRAAVAGRHVVIYNAAFDTAFLGDLLTGAADIHCCMLDWAEDAREWSEYWGGWAWWKLVEAAAKVEFEWSGQTHSAAPDALACRAAWRYLYDPAVRADIDARREARRQEREDAWEVERALWQLEANDKARDRRRAARATRFIAHWWLGRHGVSHWTAQYAQWDRDKALDDLCVLFCGTTWHGLQLMDAHPGACYRRQADIPSHLKPESWFHDSPWYRRELRPCAAYVGTRRAWPLYHRNEKRRLNRKFRLRLSPAEDMENTITGSRSWLRQQGYSVEGLEPVAERYNQVSHIWYPVYRVPRGKASP